MGATEQATPRRERETGPILTGVGVSLLLHAALLVSLGLITWAVTRPDPPRDAVITLGTSPVAFDASGAGGESMRDAAPAGPAEQPRMGNLAPAAPLPALPLEAVSMPLDLGGAGAFSNVDPALAALQLPAAADSNAPGGGTGLLTGTSGEFQDVARGLGRRGLDVVLVIDATQSMEPYAAQARDRLHDVMAVLSGILRDAGARNNPRLIRFGVVAFKDFGDDFGLDATQSLPLTSDIDAVRAFIEDLPVGGGGERDEPTHRALEAAIDARRMGWRRDRRSIILLVSDAPVHLTGRDSAPAAAAQFVQRMRGTVSVIDVGGEGEQDAKRTSILPDFIRIAKAGGGSAFLLTDREQFWTHLLTLVFGERYAQDVDLIVEKYATQRKP